MKLLQLENLRWVAFSSNPFLETISKQQLHHDTSLTIVEDIILDRDDWPILGQGAGGITRKVTWGNGLIAVKTYVGELTSDGSPQDERRISVAAAASKHPCLIQLLGQTPTGGLMMEFLESYESLAGPPSMETCSRDVYTAISELAGTAMVATIVRGLLEVLVELHDKGICHGDFYAHNILIKPEETKVKLSDFGAAFFYDRTAAYAHLVEQTELRAFGVLVEELQTLIVNDTQPVPHLDDLVRSCNDKTMTFARLWEQFQGLIELE
jgi:serine/threonine protein kinase